MTTPTPCCYIHILLVVSLLCLLYTVNGVQPPLSQKLSVLPTCGNHVIRIELTFNGDLLDGRRFEDWIIVGTTNQPECRLKGNGELQYVIEIAVFNDPCGTLMPSSGVFQNKVRIGQNPALILHGDENFIVKCVYGLPEVSHLLAPNINPAFSAVTVKELATSTVSSDLFALSGQSVPQGVPQGDGDWSGDGTSMSDVRNGGGTAAWVAVLSILGTIFLIILMLMLIFVCIRLRSENKGSMCDARSNPHIGDTVSKYGVTHCWWSGSKEAIQNQAVVTQEMAIRRNEALLAHATSQVSPSVSVTSSVPSNESTNGNSARCTQHSSGRSSTTAEMTQPPHSYSEWRNRLINNNNMERSVSLRDGSQIDPCGGHLSEVRSIDEIYRSAEMATSEGDALSQSTLEAAEYNLQNLSAVERLAKCAEQIRGFGPRKLTEQELGRWRQLITRDVDLQKSISRSRDLAQLQQLHSMPRFRALFTYEKWANIMKCVADVQFNANDQHSRRFTKRSDLQKRNQELNASSLNVYVGGVNSSPAW